MDPLKVSAEYAAYVWFSQQHGKKFKQAARYARANWGTFLPLAHEGWGKLLIRIAEPRLIKRSRAFEEISN